MTARTVAAVVAVVVLSGCTSTPAAPRPVEVLLDGEALAPPGGAPRDETAPAGTVRVAVPGPPASWWARDEGDVAAQDLASLWSLPLFQVDDLGRTRPGLARTARQVPDDAGWTVEVDLAAGEWSDGRPVVAADVVATATALAEARPAPWGAFLGAQAVDDDTVQLRFERPFARWWALLSEPPGVLPAHVLAQDGLAAWDSDVPVSGGPFALQAQRRGVSSTWVAHTGAATGPPQLAGLEVLVVPDVDVALGLLGDGATDVVAGHLALDGAGRAAEVRGAVASLPFGGTLLELAWAPTTGVPAGTRRALGTVLDPGPFLEGLLRDGGRPASGTLPGTRPAATPDGDVEAEREVRVALAGTVEHLGLLGRLVRRDAGRIGLDVRLVRLEPPDHLLAADSGEEGGRDGVLRELRRGPLPTAAGMLAGAGLDPGPGLAADARGSGAVPAGGGSERSSPWRDVDDLVAGSAMRMPFADVAPLHAWVPDRVAGVSPSAWPGLGLWDAASWRVP